MSQPQQTASPDVVWGVRSSVGVVGLSQRFALLAGLVYVVIGVVGFFFTGFSNFTVMTDSALFGIFHITPFHNIVHIGVGGLWLLGALVLTRPAVEGVNFAIAGVYVLAAVLGYLGALSFLGILPGLDADNFLHLITGVLSLLFAGIIPSRDRTEQVRYRY